MYSNGVERFPFLGHETIPGKPTPGAGRFLLLLLLLLDMCATLAALRCARAEGHVSMYKFEAAMMPSAKMRTDHVYRHTIRHTTTESSRYDEELLQDARCRAVCEKRFSVLLCGNSSPFLFQTPEHSECAACPITSVVSIGVLAKGCGAIFLTHVSTTGRTQILINLFSERPKRDLPSRALSAVSTLPVRHIGQEKSSAPLCPDPDSYGR